MRVILFILLAMIAFSCAAPPKFSYQTENLVKVSITDEETGNVETISCAVNSKDKTVDAYCYGYIERKDGIYECKVSLDSAGKPVKEILNFKETCKIVFDKTIKRE